MRPLTNSSFSQLFILSLTVLLLQACGGDDGFPNGPGYENVPEPFDTTQAVSDSTTEDGLTIYVIEEGNGQFPVISRDGVSIRYTGRTADGEIFDSTYRNGATTGRLLNLTPVAKPGPNGQNISPLIEGFRRGIIGMVEGEKRVLVIPPSLGYGDSEGHQLQDDTLYFDVELVGII